MCLPKDQSSRSSDSSSLSKSMTSHCLLSRWLWLRRTRDKSHVIEPEYLDSVVVVNKLIYMKHDLMYLVCNVLAICLQFIGPLDQPMMLLIWSCAKVLCGSFCPNVRKYVLHGVSLQKIPVFGCFITKDFNILLYDRC